MVIFWNKTKQITCKHPHFGTTLKWICKSNNNCHIIIYVHLIFFSPAFFLSTPDRPGKRKASAKKVSEKGGSLKENDYFCKFLPGQSGRNPRVSDLLFI
jgi:hypothetical protein